MKNVIEDNKLIAEFMGINLSEIDPIIGNVFFIKNTWYAPGDFEFNTSWDWLMPVIDKIEDIEQMGCQAYITFHPFCVEAYCPGNLQRGLSEFSYQLAGKKFSGTVKIEAVYEAVVEFIKWHTNA